MEDWVFERDIRHERESHLRDDLKKALNVVFKSLKKDHQFDVARQRFLCCTGCGCNEIANMNDERKKNGKPEITKWAFYHAQDFDDLDSGSVYITYGDTVEEGKAIVEAGLKAGLVPVWDGSVDTKVELLLPQVVEKERQHLVQAVQRDLKMLHAIEDGSNEDETLNLALVLCWLDREVGQLAGLNESIEALDKVAVATEVARRKAEWEERYAKRYA